MASIDAHAAASLAEAQGYPALDPAFVERIAAGAERAVAAVRASVTDTLFDADPAAFLVTLEELAPDETSL